MNINKWLEHFSKHWADHNIDAVMDLFTDDVVYWETPYYKLDSKNHLRQEWQAISTQYNIIHQTEIFNSSVDNKHAIIWKLSYVRDDEIHESAGTYLIGLNKDGLCDFFYYVSAQK
ncbi:MAG TPA: nuclear transport factor 2 family protein [Candidatus Saccharibacteria bacterium]|nr:nuclear transport factor 2 family protein [Candidatus Saccharibacteria bacterium]